MSRVLAAVTWLLLLGERLPAQSSGPRRLHLLVGDSLWLTLGDGVWMVYGLRLGGDKLTISGGDLDKPVTLRRVGPATARPDTLAIPPSPPDTARAWD
ncbi:MAG: hypothetical protein DMD28_01595 [Gemmatimonadetes bacterium]|nr:MAG: hypothetical protein DMD28_01595 [Gemmatimonadota bacterium]